MGDSDANLRNFVLIQGEKERLQRASRELHGIPSFTNALLKEGQEKPDIRAKARTAKSSPTPGDASKLQISHDAPVLSQLGSVSGLSSSQVATAVMSSGRMKLADSDLCPTLPDYVRSRIIALAGSDVDFAGGGSFSPVSQEDLRSALSQRLLQAAGVAPEGAAADADPRQDRLRFDYSLSTAASSNPTSMRKVLQVITRRDEARAVLAHASRALAANEHETIALESWGGHLDQLSSSLAQETASLQTRLRELGSENARGDDPFGAADLAEQSPTQRAADPFEGLSKLKSAAKTAGRLLGVAKHTHAATHREVRHVGVNTIVSFTGAAALSSPNGVACLTEGCEGASGADDDVGREEGAEYGQAEGEVAGGLLEDGDAIVDDSAPALQVMDDSAETADVDAHTSCSVEEKMSQNSGGGGDAAQQVRRIAPPRGRSIMKGRGTRTVSKARGSGGSASGATNDARRVGQRGGRGRGGAARGGRGTRADPRWTVSVDVSGRLMTVQEAAERAVKRSTTPVKGVGAPPSPVMCEPSTDEASHDAMVRFYKKVADAGAPAVVVQTVEAAARDLISTLEARYEKSLRAVKEARRREAAAEVHARRAHVAARLAERKAVQDLFKNPTGIGALVEGVDDGDGTSAEELLAAFDATLALQAASSMDVVRERDALREAVGQLEERVGKAESALREQGDCVESAERELAVAKQERGVVSDHLHEMLNAKDGQLKALVVRAEGLDRAHRAAVDEVEELRSQLSVLQRELDEAVQERHELSAALEESTERTAEAERDSSLRVHELEREVHRLRLHISKADDGEKCGGSDECDAVPLIITQADLMREKAAVRAAGDRQLRVVKGVAQLAESVVETLALLRKALCSPDAAGVGAAYTHSSSLLKAVGAAVEVRDAPGGSTSSLSHPSSLMDRGVVHQALEDRLVRLADRIQQCLGDRLAEPPALCSSQVNAVDRSGEGDGPTAALKRQLSQRNAQVTALRKAVADVATVADSVTAALLRVVRCEDLEGVATVTLGCSALPSSFLDGLASTTLGVGDEGSDGTALTQAVALLRSASASDGVAQFASSFSWGRAPQDSVIQSAMRSALHSAAGLARVFAVVRVGVPALVSRLSHHLLPDRLARLLDASVPSGRTLAGLDTPSTVPGTLSPLLADSLSGLGTRTAEVMKLYSEELRRRVLSSAISSFPLTAPPDVLAVVARMQALDRGLVKASTRLALRRVVLSTRHTVMQRRLARAYASTLRTSRMMQTKRSGDPRVAQQDALDTLRRISAARRAGALRSYFESERLSDSVAEIHATRLYVYVVVMTLHDAQVAQQEGLPQVEYAARIAAMEELVSAVRARSRRQALLAAEIAAVDEELRELAAQAVSLRLARERVRQAAASNHHEELRATAQVARAARRRHSVASDRISEAALRVFDSASRHGGLAPGPSPLGSFPKLSCPRGRWAVVIERPLVSGAQVSEEVIPPHAAVRVAASVLGKALPPDYVHDMVSAPVSAVGPVGRPPRAAGGRRRSVAAAPDPTPLLADHVYSVFETESLPADDVGEVAGPTFGGAAVLDGRQTPPRQDAPVGGSFDGASSPLVASVENGLSEWLPSIARVALQGVSFAAESFASSDDVHQPSTRRVEVLESMVASLRARIKELEDTSGGVVSRLQPATEVGLGSVTAINVPNVHAATDGDVGGSPQQAVPLMDAVEGSLVRSEVQCGSFGRTDALVGSNADGSLGGASFTSAGLVGASHYKFQGATHDRGGASQSFRSPLGSQRVGASVHAHSEALLGGAERSQSPEVGGKAGGLSDASCEAPLNGTVMVVGEKAQVEEEKELSGRSSSFQYDVGHGVALASKGATVCSDQACGSGDIIGDSASAVVRSLSDAVGFHTSTSSSPQSHWRVVSGSGGAPPHGPPDTLPRGTLPLSESLVSVGKAVEEQGSTIASSVHGRGGPNTRVLVSSGDGGAPACLGLNWAATVPSVHVCETLSGEGAPAASPIGGAGTPAVLQPSPPHLHPLGGSLSPKGTHSEVSVELPPVSGLSAFSASRRASFSGQGPSPSSSDGRAASPVSPTPDARSGDPVVAAEVDHALVPVTSWGIASDAVDDSDSAHAARSAGLTNLLKQFRRGTGAQHVSGQSVPSNGVTPPSGVSRRASQAPPNSGLSTKSPFETSWRGGTPSVPTIQRAEVDSTPLPMRRQGRTSDASRRPSMAVSGRTSAAEPSPRSMLSPNGLSLVEGAARRVSDAQFLPSHLRHSAELVPSSISSKPTGLDVMQLLDLNDPVSCEDVESASSPLSAVALPKIIKR